MVATKVEKPGMLEIGANELVNQWVQNPQVLVSRMITNHTRPVIGVGGKLDQSKSYLTQWQAFVAAVSARGVKEYEEAVNASQDFLRAISGTGGQERLDLTTSQTLAGLYRNLHLEPEEAVEGEVAKPQLRGKMKEVIKEKVEALCEMALAESKKLVQEQEQKDAVIKMMGGYWQHHLQRYTNDAYGFTGKVGEHGLCDVFDAEHEAVMSSIANKDAPLSISFLAAGVNVLLEIIENTPQDNIDLRQRLVFETLNLITNSTIARKLKEKETKVEGAKAVRTLGAIQQGFVYRIIGGEVDISLFGKAYSEQPEVNRKLLGAFTQYIEARTELKDPEALLLEIMLLTGAREKALKRRPDQDELHNLIGLPPTDSKLGLFESSFIASLETATEALKRGNVAPVFEILAAIRSISPYTFAVISKTVLGRTIKDWRKGGLPRVAAASKALIQAGNRNYSESRKFYHVYMASGKSNIIPGVELPDDDFIKETIERATAYTNGASLLYELLRAVDDDLPGIGLNPPGLDFMLNGSWKGTKEVRKHAFNVYFQTAMARIRDKDFNHPKKQDFQDSLPGLISTELLALGLIFRHVDGEDEQIKGYRPKPGEKNPREMFIDLLLDIKLSKAGVFAERVKKMADVVLEGCVPYMSENAIKYYVNTVVSRLYTTRYSGKVDGLEVFNRGQLFNLLIPILARINPSLPTVKGEATVSNKRGGTVCIRPIPRKIIVDALSRFVVNYPNFERPASFYSQSLLADIRDKRLKPLSDLTDLGQVMVLLDIAMTGKEKAKAARRICQDVSAEILMDYSQKNPGGITRHLDLAGEVIRDQLASLDIYRREIEGIVGMMAPLVTTPSYEFDQDTGAFVAKEAIPGGNGDIRMLTDDILDDPTESRYKLGEILKGLEDDTAKIYQSPGNVPALELITKLTTISNQTEEGSSLLDAVAHALQAVLSPITQNIKEGAKKEGQSSGSGIYVLSGDIFSSAFAVVAQLVGQMQAGKEISAQAISSALGDVLKARALREDSAISLASAAGLTGTEAARQLLDRTAIAGLAVDVNNMTAMRATVADARQALISAIEDQVNRDVEAFHDIAKKTKFTTEEERKIWFGRVEKVLELKRINLERQAHFALNAYDQSLKTVYDKAEQVIERMRTILLLANKQADEYWNFLIALNSPTGGAYQTAINIQNAIRLFWGVSTIVDLPSPESFGLKLPENGKIIPASSSLQLELSSDQ